MENRKEDLISVIVPVYNTEKYLRECVDSLLNQTYRNIEIILVDDGSTDSSPEICDEYAALDDRIKVIHKVNGGASSARNVGIQASSGRWLMFVDSDDCCMNSIVGELFSAAKNNGVPMAICILSYWNEQKIQCIDKSRLTGNIEITSSHGIITNLWKSEYDNSIFTTPVCKLYDSDYFGEQLYFVEGIICEDDELFNRLYCDEYPIAIIHSSLYLWRMNPSSVTHRVFSEKKTILLEILKNRSEIFREIGFSTQAEKTAKIYCEIYIEDYFKAYDQGHPEWVTKYKYIYGIMKKECKKIQTPKTRIRYCIFAVSPKLYRRFTKM